MLNEIYEGIGILKKHYPDAIVLDMETVMLIEAARGINDNDYHTLLIVFDEKMEIVKEDGMVYDDNLDRDASDKLENLGWWLTLRGWEFEG